MKNIFLTLFIFLLFVSNVCSQKIIDSSSSNRPLWLAEPPEGKYYRYFSGIGNSSLSLSDAKQQAISDVLSEIIMEERVIASSKIKTYQQQTNSEIISIVSREIEQTGMSSTIEGLLKEEDYWEILKIKKNQMFRYWILMKIPKPEYSNFPLHSIKVDQSYGNIPILKSALVPGWGQIHKKEKKKGFRILGLFTASVFLGTTLKKISDNYEIDAQNANTGEWIDYYNTLAEQYYIGSAISFITAATIYGYNFYDAISSPGAKIYASENIDLKMIYLDRAYFNLSIKL